MCYHVKFGSSAAKGVRINRREPQSWGALGHRPLQWGRGRPLEIRPRLTCYPAEFGRYRSNGISERTQIDLLL